MQLARREGGGRGGAAGGRGREPGQDAVLHRRQPRPAPAAARDGPVRRGAAPAHPRARGGAARQQHQRIGRCARGPVLRAARHHADRQRRRRGQPAELRGRRHLPQAPPALRADGLREGARACASAAAGTSPSPTRCWSSGSCATWSSNAIRYTIDGSVLRQLPAARRDGCGCRSGTPARASAKRSGRASSRSSTRCRARRAGAGEHKKGLGLGLAIVKRLARPDGGAARAALPSSAAARSSRSSCRSARRRVRRHAVQPGKGPTGVTLDGRLIVIVEDEPAVREGLEVLLRGWGASIARLRQRRRDAGLGRRPAIRRRRGRRCSSPTTGWSTARPASRRSTCCAQRFGAALPAIVVTGSSMTGHEQGSARARLPRADQAGAAEQAAGDDRLQARRR